MKGAHALTYSAIVGETVYTHSIHAMVNVNTNIAENIPEDITSNVWLLETLGVDNSSQAVVKLSGITLLFLMASVLIILVLDAHFVAKMRSSSDTHVGVDMPIEVDPQNDEVTGFISIAEIIDIHSEIEEEDIEAAATTRSFLSSSLFTDSSSYRQVYTTAIGTTCPNTTDSGPLPDAIEDTEVIRSPFHNRDTSEDIGLTVFRI